MENEQQRNEYPKTMQSKTGQSVVVANEEQEESLPSDFGGKAKGKSYAEVALAAKEPLTQAEKDAPLTAEEKQEQKTLDKLSHRK